MEVVSLGQGANGHAPSSAAAIIDPELVVGHLVDLLEITLGARAEELKGKGSLLSEAKRNDTVQRCTRFASESQVALYVQKTVATAELPKGTANGHSVSGKWSPVIIADGLLTLAQTIPSATSTRCQTRYLSLQPLLPP